MGRKEHNIEHCLVCGLLLTSGAQCPTCDAAKIRKNTTITNLDRKNHAKIKTEGKKSEGNRGQKTGAQGEFQSVSDFRNTSVSNPAFLFNKMTKERFELSRTVSRLGRDHNNNISIAADDHISRNHAWILHNKGKFWVEDLGSTNGTLLNGKPVTIRMQLAAGDRLTFGKTELIFVVD